ncbi:VanZ family protein [Actinoplanes sp. CA-030573]|uniref:VanZ family protein n=1 Tax=Actinoplanes sp. CA-030573 TaxID=3239898 RepID=UPI003D91BAB7
MRNDPVVVPALPILLPLGVLAMVVSWLLLRRRGLLTPMRLAACWFAGWYAVAVLGATFLPMHLAPGSPPQLFRINPLPLYALRPTDFVLNVVMTLPFAGLLDILFGIRDRARVLRLGLMLSASIEITQAVLILTVHDNRWAEANDLVSNVLGVYLGWLAFHALLRFGTVRRVVGSAAGAPVSQVQDDRAARAG